MAHKFVLAVYRTSNGKTHIVGIVGEQYSSEGRRAMRESTILNTKCNSKNLVAAAVSPLFRVDTAPKMVGGEEAGSFSRASPY